jgi:hypothetical protein
VAGVALILIAAIPHGHLPERVFGWLPIVLMGVLVGAWCGAVIGAICGNTGPVRIGDVMAAAIKRPGEALRSLLDPEELIKLGAAVRQRTTHMLESLSESLRDKKDPPE